MKVVQNNLERCEQMHHGQQPADVLSPTSALRLLRATAECLLRPASFRAVSEGVCECVKECEREAKTTHKQVEDSVKENNSTSVSQIF